MRFVLLALGSLTLAGCNLAYRLPEGAAQTAKVRFSAPEAQFGNSVSIYSLTSEGSCAGAQKLRHVGGLQLGGLASKDTDIGMLKITGADYKRNSYVEIPIVAEQRANFALQGTMRGRLCSLNVSFFPKAERQYEVLYYASGDSCYARISELVTKEGAVRPVRELSAKRNEQTCGMFWN